MVQALLDFNCQCSKGPHKRTSTKINSCWVCTVCGIEFAGQFDYPWPQPKQNIQVQYVNLKDWAGRHYTSYANNQRKMIFIQKKTFIPSSCYC